MKTAYAVIDYMNDPEPRPMLAACELPTCDFCSKDIHGEYEGGGEIDWKAHPDCVPSALRFHDRPEDMEAS